MTGIWLDNPNPPGPPAPNPYPNSGVIVGDSLYFGGDALVASHTQWTVINSNALIASGNGIAIELVVGGNVTNASAGAVIQGVYEGVALEGAGGVLVNYGIITGYYAAVARPGSSITNEAGGTITGGVDGIFLGSFGYPASGSGVITNNGLVQATGGRGRGNGIVLNVQSATVTNTGTVIGNGGPNASGLGIAFNYGGYLRNAQTASIRGYAAGVSADHKTPMTVVNDGSIAGTIAGIRVQLATGTIVNTGTILASSMTAGIGIYLKQGGTVLNKAGAYINGPADGIEIAGTLGTVTNFGRVASIAGSTGTHTGGAGVLLAAGGTVGNDNTSGMTGPRYGVIAGYTVGVDIRGIAGTVINSGTILGSSTAGIGVRLEAGGTVTNRVTAGVTGIISGSLDGIDISGTRGTTINFGSVVATGSAGIGVRLEAGGTVINRASTGTIGLISAVQTGVDIAGGAAAQPSTAANYGTVVATGSAGIGIKLENGGIVVNGTTSAATALISGVQAGIDILGTAGTVTNYGTVTATGTGGIGVKIEAGGTVANGTTGATGALISGVQTGVAILGTSGTVRNFATISATGTTGIGVTLAAGGTVANGTTGSTAARISAVQAGIAISSGTAVPTVSNYGTIAATGTTGIAVTLASGGKVVNGSTQSANALVTGVQTGVAATGGPGPATLTNYGSITATGSTGTGITFAAGGYVMNGSTQATAGLVYGLQSGIDISGSAGTVANFATISTLSPNANPGVGVKLENGGTVSNGSTSAAAAQILGYRAGIDISGGIGSVVNFGSISANGKFGAGVKLEAGGQVSTGISIPGATKYDASTVFGTASIIYGTQVGVDVSGGVGSVANYGSISAAGVGNGVFLEAGGVVNNTQKSSLIAGGNAGLEITDGAATLNNLGTITGGNFGVGFFRDASGTIINGIANTLKKPVITGGEGISIGVETGSTTIFNFGTIASTTGSQGIAIDLGSGNDTVVIEPFSTIIGYVANLHLGDRFVIPNTTGNTRAGPGIVAATIGTLNGVQTLQIREADGGFSSPFSSIYNVAVRGSTDSPNLSGDYFNVTQDGTNTALTLAQGNPLAISVGATTVQRGGIDGAGITVGIVSDSFGDPQADIDSDALPSDVTIIRRGSGNDEGRAMAEIIHDIAPRAAIAFAAVGSTQSSFAAAINKLVAAGCQVIVDDVHVASAWLLGNNPNEAGSGSPIEDAIDAAVGAGVTYVTSAGNYRNKGFGRSGTEPSPIFGHAADKLALTVAAINLLAAPNPPATDGAYLTPPATENFSSIGATADKPNVTGPDGGPTTLGLEADTNSLDPFFGTSAAAPAVAAVAALVLEANPQLQSAPLSVDQIIEKTATPFGEAATMMGTGYVQAAAAVADAKTKLSVFYRDPQPAVSVATASLSQPSGNIAAGATLRMFLTMNAPVTVIGTPSLVLNDGGSAVYDAARSQPGNGALTFDYAVAAADRTANLSITGLSLNGGSIQDTGGNSADFSGLFDAPAGVSVNSPLSVTAVAATQREVGTGQTARLTLTLNEAVSVGVAGGPPTLILNNGGTAVYDGVVSNPASGVLAFDYTVAAIDDPTPNLRIFSVNLPSGTTITDADGNSANVSAALTQAGGLQVGPAFVANVFASPLPTASTGQLVQLTVDLSGGVTVNALAGTPTLSLNDGETAVYDAAASKPAAGSLLFDYTVAAKDQTSDLTVTGINLNGATVIDANGVNVDFSKALNYPVLASINSPLLATQVTTSPTVAATGGQTVRLTLAMNEAVSVDTLDNFGGPPTLTLNDGATASFDLAASNPAAGTLVFDYTVGAADRTPNLAISQVNLPGPIFTDAGGNLPDFSGVLNVGTGLRITAAPSLSPAVLNDFGWQQGWGSPNNPRMITDVNGDGSGDYLGFGDDFTFIAYGGTFASGQGQSGAGFSSNFAAVPDFGTNEGYVAVVQRGAAATGAGVGDSLYGQGFAGVWWYAAASATAATDAAGKTYNVLNYQSAPNFYGNFGSLQGWTPDNGLQILKSTATDTYASILGFGDDGIVVGPQAFAPGATAAGAYVIPLAAGNNFGWSQSVDIRTFTDVGGKTIDLNGDGIADFVGFGPQGLAFAFGNDNGPNGSYQLGALQNAQISGSADDLGEAQGWTDSSTLRYVVADPQTGFDDIIAFGNAGVLVAMGQDPATHNGQPFGQLYLAMPDFGGSQGWSVGQTPRIVGDVNGDGIPDLVGFGASATFVAAGSRDAAGNLHFALDPSQTIGDFGYTEGWSGSDPQTIRALAHINSGSGGGRADLVLSGAFNTQVWQFG